MCQEKILGLKYNYNSHRAHILATKVNDKQRQTQGNSIVSNNDGFLKRGREGNRITRGKLGKKTLYM